MTDEQYQASLADFQPAGPDKRPVKWDSKWDAWARNMICSGVIVPPLGHTYRMERIARTLWGSIGLITIVIVGAVFWLPMLIGK